MKKINVKEYMDTIFYRKIKDYNERKICTGVGFNYNIGIEDVNVLRIWKMK